MGEPEIQEKTTKIRFHLSQSVRGALRNWVYPQDYQQVFMKNDNEYATAEEAREFLLDCLSDGVECIPMNDCPTFDVKKGCPGHEYK